MFSLMEEEAIPKGWKSWEHNPPKIGEKVVRRTISDMVTTYAGKDSSKWKLIRGAFRVGGGLQYIWQSHHDYSKDPEERITRGKSHIS